MASAPAQRPVDSQPALVFGTTRLYPLPGYSFRLTSPDETMLREFDRRFGAFSGTVGHLGHSVHYVHHEPGTNGLGHLVTRDGEAIASFSSTLEVIEYLQWEITQACCSKTDRFVAIHAAAIAEGGQALVLVGPSGSGKSSLTAELLRRGMEYVTDEAVLLDRHTGLITPFPRGIGLLQLSGDSEPAGKSATRKQYLSPHALGSRVAHEPPAARTLVFLSPPGSEHTPGPWVRPLNRVDALPCLVSQVFAGGPAVPVLDALVRLIAGAEVYTLRAGSIQNAAEALFALSQCAPAG